MGSEDGSEKSPGDRSDPERVVLLLADAENRRLLADWLRTETTLAPVVPDDHRSADGGDLCIVDDRALGEAREWIQTRKRREAPGFYPALLVHGDDGRRVPEEVWDVVDEVVRAPIRMSVFERRLANLLERRSLTVSLERRLLDRVDRYRAVFEASNDAVVVVDPDDDRVVDANRRASELLGYSRGELAVLSPSENVFSGADGRYDEFVHEVRETGRGWTDDLVVTRKDRTELVAEVSASGLDVGDGTQLVASIRDVTERRAQQLALEQKRDELDELHRLNRTLRKTTQAVARASTRAELERDVCEELTVWERYASAWVGVVDEDAGEIVPRTAVGVVDDYLDEITMTVDDSPTGGGPAGTAIREGEVSVVTNVQADARFEPWRAVAIEHGIHSSAGVPVHHDGEVYGVLGIYATERNAFGDRERDMLADLGATVGHAIHALEARTEAHLFEEAVEHAGHAIYITDADGVVEYVNSAFERSTGFARPEVIGEHHSILRTGEDDPSYPDGLPRDLDAGETRHAETTARRRDGRRQYVEQTVTPFRGSDDGDTRYVAVRMDVTDQRRREQQLQTLHRVLRHNIRNELNVVLGYLDVLDERTQGAAGVDAMEKIRSSTDELLRISRQARRIEQTFVEPDDGGSRERRDLGDVVRRRCTSAGAQFPDGTVDARVDGGVGVGVDPEFATALEEVLTNALRHNDRSAPHVVCEARVTDGAGGSQAVVSVRDDGPGIPDYERRVLEEGEETPLLHGSGLGLWLVNWILQELGGDVAIEDNAPRGTVVRFRLPL